MDLPEQVEIETVRLERMRMCVMTRLSAELAYAFGEPPEVAVTPALEMITDEIAVRVVQTVWGRELDRKEVRWPANWWEAVKARFLPAWVLERWPVRYRCVTLTAREFYPKIGPMPKGRVVTIEKSELTW